METIEKSFTYNLPDEYTSQTSNLGLTGTYTYNGPRYLAFEIQEGTGKIVGAFPTTKELYQTLNDVPDTFYFLVDAKYEPLIASIFFPAPLTGNETQKVYNLPDGLTYSRPNPTTPDHTYSKNEITFNLTLKDFNRPFPWYKPVLNWMDVGSSNERLINDAQEKIEKLTADNADSQLIQAWVDWKAEAESKIELYRDAGLMPYMVTYSTQPGAPDPTDVPNEPAPQPIGYTE